MRDVFAVLDTRPFKIIEKVINKTIPYLLIVLAFVIPLDYFHYLEHYAVYVEIFDYAIIIFFVIDLVFKWHHTRNLRTYVRLYWLDLVAVFPFLLVFRLYARIATLVTVSEEIAEAQKLAHEAVLAREAKLLKEAELAREARLFKEAELLKETRLLREAELVKGTRLLREVRALGEEKEELAGRRGPFFRATQYVRRVFLRLSVLFHHGFLSSVGHRGKYHTG